MMMSDESGGGATRRPPARAPRQTATPYGPSPRGISYASPSAPKPARHDQRDGGGNFLSNRKGVKLCPGFQDGTCTERDNYNQCLKDPSLRHQCSRCLSQHHGANSPECPGSHTPTGKGKGKKGGKGKGKKGGGKGKKGW